MLRYKYNYFDRKGVVRHIQTFFDYATQMGLKPHKVPLYETIYYGIIHGYAVTLYQFYYTGDMILSVNTTLPAPEDEAALNQFILDLDIKEKYHLHHVHIKNDFIGLFAWMGYTFAPGYRGIFKPFIMLGITLTELLLGLLLLPLFGSITALPPGSTETSVLIFISFVFAVFLLVLIWIMEAIFYANEKRHGFYGVTTWKNKK